MAHNIRRFTISSSYTFLGITSSHFAKPLSNKPKRSFIGLVKIVEGLISAEDLEKDFGFHFP
jgi:hypothetical protein